MEDPIPLSVLLRYVLSPDGEETAYPNLIPLAQQRSLIQSKLIIRKVLRVRDSIPSDDSIGDYPRKHPFPIQVSTERKCLHFSEPIVIKEPDDKKNKEEDSKSVSSEEPSNPIPIPHYQRPQNDDNDDDDDDEQFDEEETTRTNTEISSGNQENDDDLVEIVIGRRKEEEDDNDGDDSCTITFEKKDDDNEQQQDDDDYFGINEIRDRGTACDICLLEFEVGDDVAWSPNLDCIHSFHKDCVLDWLVRKPTCPNCRHDYLTGKQDDVV